MKSDLLSILACPVGCKGELIGVDGMVECKQCLSRYSIENGLLNFLPKKLSLQAKEQQLHFDSLKKTGQPYTDFERQIFWQVVDEVIYSRWREKIFPGSWLLDVGCAQGRSIARLTDLPINIVALDISKNLVDEGRKRFAKYRTRAKIHFLVADASTRLPFRDGIFDTVVVYGVLHHLAKPKEICREIGRVLKNEGWYLGNENNDSGVRIIFDLLQRVIPAWQEKAGPEHLFSSKKLINYFKTAGLNIRTETSVFLPPQIINLLSPSIAIKVFNLAENFFGKIPIVKNHGGLLVLEGQKVG